MTQRIELFTDRLMKPIAHFSHAMRVNELVHVGATAGTDANRRLAGETIGRSDVAAQARRMLANLIEVLQTLGSSREGLIRIKSYIADPREQAIYQEVYAELIGDRPLHVLVGSHGFPLPHACVEIDALAMTDTAMIERSPHHAGLIRAGSQFHLLAQPAGQRQAIMSSDTGVQCDEALSQLDRLLSDAQLTRTDVVALHISVIDAYTLGALKAALQRWAGAAELPACTVLIAPLVDTAIGVQIEAIAIRGGGHPIHAKGVTSAIGSPAVLADGYLYLGAVLAQENARLNNDPLTQTRSCWDQIQRLLDAAGMDSPCIVRTNNILSDWRHYRGFNQGYGEHIPSPYPPRTTMHGGLCLPNANVHIEALAHTDARTATVLQTTGFTTP